MNKMNKMNKDELEKLKQHCEDELLSREILHPIKNMCNSIKQFVAEEEYADAAELEHEMYGIILRNIADDAGHPRVMARLAMEIHNLDYERF